MRCSGAVVIPVLADAVVATPAAAVCDWSLAETQAVAVKAFPTELEKVIGRQGVDALAGWTLPWSVWSVVHTVGGRLLIYTEGGWAKQHPDNVENTSKQSREKISSATSLERDVTRRPRS